MSKHGRRQQPPPRPSAPAAPSIPTLAELESFSEAGLRRWRDGWEKHRDIYTELYFGFEKQRANAADAIRDALLANACKPIDIEDWARIVDYKYSLTPLSVAGSVTGDGGRFNIGAGLNPSSFPPFPALYIGNNEDTAYAEKFAIRRTDVVDDLTADEIVLRKANSYTFVRLSGKVELCFDASNDQALKAFVDIIRHFKMPPRAPQIARSMRKLPPVLITTVARLKYDLLHKDWNTLPVHFDLPSNSQIFGRLLAAAGFHGVMYPSAREPGGICLALFPQNWKGSSSIVKVADSAPEHATLTLFDGASEVFQ